MRLPHWNAIPYSMEGRLPIPLVVGLFMTVVVIGCGQGGSPVTDSPPAGRSCQVVPGEQGTSRAIDLPHAIAAAVRSGDGSALVPYLASKEDYVIVTPGGTPLDPHVDAAALEVGAAGEAMRLVERCRDLGHKSGMVLGDIKVNLVRSRFDLLAPYDERLLTGERLDEVAAETDDTALAGFLRGMPADKTIGVELESHGKPMSIVLSVRRTPKGPRIIEFQGCAALTIQQLLSVKEWQSQVYLDRDAAAVTLITRGMVSEEFQGLRGHEVYSAPRTWILMPPRADPTEKDMLDIWFEIPDLSMLGLPEVLGPTADRLVETASDSCTFVSVLRFTTKLTMTPPIASGATAGTTSAPGIEVNGIRRHFHSAGMGGRLLVAPRETVKELLIPVEGHPGCHLRYEDGLAAEVIWIAPEADGAPTSSSTTAAEESK